MVKKNSTNIMVPKSNKKPISENKEVEKQAKTEVSQGEVGKEKKVNKNTTLKFDSSKMQYQFFDPLKALPEQFHGEIPNNKLVFFVPLKTMFTYSEENFKNIMATGNGYAYARYEEVTLKPTDEIDFVKQFMCEVMEKDRHVVIILDDPKITEINKKLAIDLVKRSLYKFRIPYSDVINSYDGDDMYFVTEGTCSYVTIIPVHSGEETYKFVGYSVNIEISSKSEQQ